MISGDAVKWAVSGLPVLFGALDLQLAPVSLAEEARVRSFLGVAPREK